jgi:hypothetical protein
MRHCQLLLSMALAAGLATGLAGLATGLAGLAPGLALAGRWRRRLAPRRVW